MVFEISKYALMDRVREKKEIEDAIAAAGDGGGADLGSYNSVEQLVLVGETVALDPEIHTSWLQTSSAGPTALTLIGPLPFAVGFRKLIFMEHFEFPGDDTTLDPSFIRLADGVEIATITFTDAPQYLLLEAWDTDMWRVVRSSGVTIV